MFDYKILDQILYEVIIICELKYVVVNNLAKNIRYLRKQKHWSQEELAKKLDVKRSSIAAYESKNVEPRLKTILELGKTFNVDLTDMIEKDIEAAPNEVKPFIDRDTEVLENQPIKIDFKNKGAIQDFIETTISTRKMLDGLKVFYKFKLDRNSDQPNLYSSDINSFILLVEHLLSNNEMLVNFLTKNRPTTN